MVAAPGAGYFGFRPAIAREARLTREVETMVCEVPGAAQRKYVQRAAMVVAKVERLVVRLERDPGDAESLRLMAGRFHSLAEGAGPCGFTAAAVAAHQAAHDCSILLATQTRPRPPHLCQIRAQLRAVCDGLAQYTIATVPPPRPAPCAAATLDRPPVPPPPADRKEALRRLFASDGLPQVLSPGAFLDAAAERHEELSEADESSAFWVSMLVEDLPAIEERRGRQAGDRVRGACSALLRAQLRRGDVAGRCGPAEFAAIFQGCSRAEAEERLRRLGEELAAVSFGSGEGGEFQVQASFGMAELAPWMGFGDWKEAAASARPAASVTPAPTRPDDQPSGAFPEVLAGDLAWLDTGTSHSWQTVIDAALSIRLQE